mmetsp:Transcript_13746/g.20163  ORF Transcript_13746/g.20163 Transcript_13746/m.20163 type:complete len:801 (-) Transcript_13746:170-2572(-)
MSLLSTHRYVDPLEVCVTISTPTNDAHRNEIRKKTVDLMQANKMVMKMLTSKFTFAYVQEFQHHFSNRTIGREAFLKQSNNTPNLDEQLLAGIIYIMSNPTSGYRPCGYLDQFGNKCARDKAESEGKTFVSMEEKTVWDAVRMTKECFKFIHDHRDTLCNRFTVLFNTPMLNAIKNIDPCGTKVKDMQKIKRMDKESVLKNINNIQRAIEKFPHWYCSKVNSNSDVRKGEVVISELENLKVILLRYCSHLKAQDSRNIFALNKTTSSLPNKTNTDFITIDRAPTRQPLNKRSEDQKERYKRVDSILAIISSEGFYNNVYIDDKAMGIDGKEWDNHDRRAERKKFVKLLGSSKFKMGMYTYRPACAVSNFVVVFKMERTASLLCPAAQQCRAEAEEKAPRYLSWQETKEAVDNICSATDTNVRTAYASLTSILPENVLLHNTFNKHQGRILHEVASLLFSADASDKEHAALIADLRQLNCQVNGELESKFDVYWDAVDKVIELNGAGAEQRRQPIGDNVECTSNMVYAPMINSLSQLAAATKKYLTDEMKLEEGKDFHIPSLELVCRQFSPSHENRQLASTFSGKLNAKRSLQSKCARPNHAHAHCAAQQKKLYQHFLSDIRCRLENEFMNMHSPIDASWEYYVVMLGLDDKCGIPVSCADNPVAAVRHSTVSAIVPNDTEVVAADHDWKQFKMTPSFTLDMSISEDSGDSLLSGGNDGNGRIYASLHDATFEKSTNYHHVASSLDILRSSQIKMLIRDKLLFNSSQNMKYKDLCKSQQKWKKTITNLQVLSRTKHNTSNG